MKRLCGFLCVVVLLSATPSIARGASYRGDAEAIVGAAQGLEDLVKRNAVDLDSYDKWYKDFSDMFAEFKKNFFNTYRQTESFKSIQDAHDIFASVWSKLNQVEYSQAQYKEYITLNNVASAHNWKNTAITQRKEALDAIARGLELLDAAEEQLEGEND